MSEIEQKIQTMRYVAYPVAHYTYPILITPLTVPSVVYVRYPDYNPFEDGDEDDELQQSLDDYQPPPQPLDQKIIESFVRIPAREEHTRENCPICQDSYALGQELSILPCRHVFHTDCVNNWFKEKSNCPCCRTNLSDQNEN